MHSNGNEKKRSLFRVLWSIPALLTIAFGAIVFAEVKASFLQAVLFSKIGDRCGFTVENGRSPRIRFPATGPYDKRLGYTAIPAMTGRLGDYGFTVERQARWSPGMERLFDMGFNIPYTEKQRAGLRIFDAYDRYIYGGYFPSPIYTDFDSIPGIIVTTLLFIEDHNLLDSARHRLNPAVDWTRLSLALLRLTTARLGRDENVPGASTLATQMEKYRHSPEGLTENPSDKIRQMISASLRAYRFGSNTTMARKDIVLNYINTAPLGAFPGYGEVSGLGEGLSVWYGTNFDSVNASLGAKSGSLADKARYFRMVISLMVAHRRPEYYLFLDTTALDAKTDYYLRLFHKQLLISDELFNAALSVRNHFRKPNSLSFERGRAEVFKSALSVRNPLIAMLDVPGVYDLDRLDCAVRSTLDSAATASIGAFFHRLKTPGPFLDSLGVRGFRMLQTGDPARINYSLNLYEKSDSANAVRIHVDTYDSPFNFNSGSKLDLGSTAKLRTLITYLEIIETLHRDFRSIDRRALGAIVPGDPLTAWAKAFMLHARDTGLTPMLEAALDRCYPASPHERFFTGGGMHRFTNFDNRHNSRSMSVREAFTFSVNLVFVRLMRDIVDFHIARNGGGNEAAASDDGAEKKRDEYLSRFIEYESGIFVAKFHQQLKSIPPSALADTLVAQIPSSPARLAVIYCSVTKYPFREGFNRFLKRYVIPDMDSNDVTRYFNQARSLSLSDRGYIAGIHPLKLWTASYLAQNRSVTLRDLKSASVPHLHEVYRWMYSPRRAAFQNSRIRIMLEMEAFVSILHSWQKLGYPFAEMVPSYASALGASADRPSALSRLAGIILNDGVAYPEQRIERIVLGGGTPYETVLRASVSGEQCRRVISAEIAREIRSCLVDVVGKGTAARARNAFDTSLVIGGKTGTGDHRQRTFNTNGCVTGKKVVSRSAVFVFFIGDRFFGTLTAAVTGPEAAGYGFTSSYPVQLFVHCAPLLRPLLEKKPRDANAMTPGRPNGIVRDTAS